MATNPPPPPTGKTPLEQMRQEHVIDLPTPAFSREVNLADILEELRAIHNTIKTPLESRMTEELGTTLGQRTHVRCFDTHNRHGAEF